MFFLRREDVPNKKICKRSSVILKSTDETIFTILSFLRSGNESFSKNNYNIYKKVAVVIKSADLYTNISVI